MGDFPQSLKGITKFLKTAKQLDANAPVMAYYCRCYAVQLGIQLRETNPSSETDGSKDVLITLITQLEEDKGNLASELHQMNHEYVINYALNTFKMADDSDKSGNTNYKLIARNFYHSTIFFDVFKQFESLSDEVCTIYSLLTPIALCPPRIC
eukprot:TRINITY_DN5306_c0_g1_i2.p1 TRINITY_DN5306_c0_g1~~TRINITY_DN5306_c0_g1_i2.p1  ORF type:complete len:153 (-),score=25.45 TRINITY_DN5306_c0_g1_i2:425-883(-)